MTRMPMIAVIALLLLQVTTSTLGKPTAASPAGAVEEETTSFGELDVSTVTMKIDLDLILSTEDNQNPFTHLPENEFATTEEPLPKSVLLQLEREHAEAKNASANLIESTTTTTTTNAPGAATTIAIESAKNELHSLYTEHDLEMRENKAEAAIETTTFLPQFEVTATPENNLAFYAKTNSYESNLEDTTTYLPMDNYKYTSGPLPADAEKYGTEVPPAEENTWIPNFDGILHSTQADDGLAETTPEPENTNNQTESSISNNVPIVATTPQPVDIGDLLRMMSSDVITDKIMQESTTEEPKLEATTNKLAEQTAETTIAPPKQQSSMLEAIVMTTFRAPVDTTTVESSTAKIIEEFPVTTIEPPKETTTPAAAVTSTASPAPQTTSSPVTTSAAETTNIPETTFSPVTTSIPEIISSTTSTPETTSSTAETTSTPETTSSTTSTPETTSGLSLTEDIVETTIEPPKQQSVLAAVSTTTPESVPESSTTEATTTSSSTTTTTTTTTTEPPTTTTTEPIPVVVTREPRVERIFNSDGVEVLYGYSSVVRTNGV